MFETVFCYLQNRSLFVEFNYNLINNFTFIKYIFDRCLDTPLLENIRYKFIMKTGVKNLILVLLIPV